MLARFRRVVRVVGTSSRRATVVGAGRVRRGQGGRADSELGEAHVHVQGDSLLRDDGAVLRIAIAALPIGHTLAVRGHVAVAGALGDSQQRGWWHRRRWRCGRRGRLWRRGRQRRWLWRLWRGRRRRRWGLCATDHAHPCDRRVLIAPPAPGVFEPKVFAVEDQARGTPHAVARLVGAAQAPDGDALRVDQAQGRAVCVTRHPHIRIVNKQARARTHAVSAGPLGWRPPCSAIRAERHTRPSQCAHARAHQGTIRAASRMQPSEPRVRHHWSRPCRHSNPSRVGVHQTGPGRARWRPDQAGAGGGVQAW